MYVLNANVRKPERKSSFVYRPRCAPLDPTYCSRKARSRTAQQLLQATCFFNPIAAEPLALFHISSSSSSSSPPRLLTLPFPAPPTSDQPASEKMPLSSGALPETDTETSSSSPPGSSVCTEALREVGTEEPTRREGYRSAGEGWEEEEGGLGGWEGARGKMRVEEAWADSQS